MRPDTSRWREHSSYDYFDKLATEGLAWECLRRHTPYQHQYQALASAREDTAPLPVEDQRRWGLRFPGATESVCARANHLLVAGRRAVRADVCVHT
ncbi:transcriptional regulator domain-containing protein [Nitrobacter sp.]|uniref:transcriptional regulator domain-containing protein n=1 Tax=Nitrobacter sp. TaxID=29420 RepID=UPI003F64CB69